MFIFLIQINFDLQEKTLRLVNKLPDMLKLQSIMSRCLNQKINSDETRSIKEVIDELFNGKIRSNECCDGKVSSTARSSGEMI